jgi:hypothetical protein
MAFDTIQASVGKHHNGTVNCFNLPSDVVVIVKLLNFIAKADGGTSDDRLDARASAANLYTAILRFQATQNTSGRMPRLSVDGHVDPGGTTLLRLNQFARKPGPVEPPDVPEEPIIWSPESPMRLIPLFATDWRFADAADAALALGNLRLATGRFRLQRADSIVDVHFHGIGFQIGGVSPFPSGPTALLKFIRGNLSSFLKLALSPSTLFVDGTILKNPVNVSGDLELRHLTEGFLIIFKGDTGVFVQGAQALLVYFGVSLSLILGTSTIVPNLPAIVVASLIEGRLPFPNAVGILGKVSGGPAGSSISVTVGRIVNARIVS